MSDRTIYNGKGQTYPDNPNVTVKRNKVAGIEGRMVGEREGAHDEDAVACGEGQAIERMGKVAGKANPKVSKKIFADKMRKQW